MIELCLDNTNFVYPRQEDAHGFLCLLLETAHEKTKNMFEFDVNFKSTYS
jgi:hypothetical protein